MLTTRATLKVHSQVRENFWQMKALKNDEKCFLFQIKSSFRSEDIQLFVLNVLVV